MAKLNPRRVALSLGIVGVIVAPFYTGSLVRFAKHPFYPSTAQYEHPIDATDFACLDDPSAKSNCVQVLSDLKNARIYPASLDATLLLSLLRDIGIGLFAPIFFLLVFPRVFGRYWHWLSS